MRGAMTVVLVFLVCLVLAVLYIFLGRTQMSKGISNLSEQNDALQAQLDDIRLKEQAIPKLMERLPLWSKQLEMFEQAIPSQIDDHVFFANLSKEVEANNVQILKLETSVGDPWLGQINEEVEAELTELGINVNAARGVRVAFYSATMVGEFDDILTVFENLKRYNRLYTLELVAGPAATGTGTSAESLDANLTPMTFSGKLYYGISEEEVSQETLARVFSRAISGPAARQIFNGVKGTAVEVPAAPAAGNGTAGNGGQADAGGAERQLAAAGAGQPGDLEGWIR